MTAQVLSMPQSRVASLGKHLVPTLGAWLELHAYEQQLVRDALKEKRIPEKIARVIGICCNADDPPAWM